MQIKIKYFVQRISNTFLDKQKRKMSSDDRTDNYINFLISDDTSTLRQGAEKRRKVASNASKEKLLRSIAAVLKSLNVDNYDPLVLRQLSSFVHNHVRSIMLRALKLQQHRSNPSSSSSSSSFSHNSNSNSLTKITLHDIQAAVRSWGQNKALMQEDSSMARKHAQKLNRKPLPKIKAVFGMQVPAPSRCFLNEEYTVAVVEEEGSGAIPVNASSSSSSSSSPNRNNQQHRNGRKRRRGRGNSEEGARNNDIDFSKIQPAAKKSKSSGGSGKISIKIG